VSRVGRAGDVQDHAAFANRDAFPGRARRDRCRSLSRHRRLLRRPCACLPRGDPHLAAAGRPHLQIDEVKLAYLFDAVLRKQVANIGEDPTTLPRTYAKLLNATIEDRPRDMTVCMHLCGGNFAGAWVADGGYEPIAELIFNEIKVDGYFLEYDSARAGGF